MYLIQLFLEDGLWDRNSNKYQIEHLPNKESSTLAFNVNENALLGPIQSLRAAYAAGALLPKEGPDRQFIGILPTSPDRGNISFIPPTKTFSDQMDVDISGVKLKLIHVQGETTDHINVWHPEDPLVQINALDTALSFHPNFVVGSHQKPIFDPP